jgi:hypothetical protein
MHGWPGRGLWCIGSGGLGFKTRAWILSEVAVLSRKVSGSEARTCPMLSRGWGVHSTLVPCSLPLADPRGSSLLACIQVSRACRGVVCAHSTGEVGVS